jgi:hypothetical protein
MSQKGIRLEANMARGEGDVVGCLNLDAVDEALENHEDLLNDRSKRRLIAQVLGPDWNANDVSQNVRRGRIWPSAELNRIADYCGVPVLTIIDHERTAVESAKESVKPRAVMPKNFKDRALHNDDMRKIYGTLGLGSFVSVFSSDTFIERSDPYFFDMVANAVTRGLHLFYFFPDGPSGDRCADDYEALYQRFHARFGDPSARVRAFYLDSTQPICGRASSFVVIGSIGPDGAYRPENVYHYVPAEGGIWFPLNSIERDRFVSELTGAIDPIPFVCRSVLDQEGSLPTSIQSAYQTAFGSGAQAYERIRGVVKTDQSAQRIVQRVEEHFGSAGRGFDRENKVLEWLDVGAEDGKNTQTMYDGLRRHGFRVALTAVDSSLQQGTVADALRFGVYYNGPKWTFEHFDEEIESDTKFHVITALHSWYVINPINLLKAYRRLKPNGILVVTLGPLSSGDWSRDPRNTVPKEVGFILRPDQKHPFQYDPNFINVITRVADQHSADHRGEQPTAYMHKIAEADKFRNFAEDLYAVANEFFGDQQESYVFKIDNREVPSEIVMGTKSLTPLGKSIVDFFLHGYAVADKVALYREVFSELSKIRSDSSMLPACEIDFVFTKRLGASVGSLG